jgi:mono/diheme cytochrome c family protein
LRAVVATGAAVTGGDVVRFPRASALSLIVAAPLLASAASGAQPRTESAEAWLGCCGLTPWPQAGPMIVKPRSTTGIMGGFGYIVGGSPLRHHLGVTGQIPAPYATLKNPLPPTPQNAQLGAAVYDAECASCHGATGLGDGAASRNLKTPPAQLGWVVKIPPGKRDAFMYWSIADGGEHFGTAMPSYKGKLTDENIWAVIGYIQARLPIPKAAP